MKRLILLFALMWVPVAYVQAQNYVLGPGDLVQVTVYQNDDLNTRSRVSDAGTINFPLLGSVRIGGLTEQRAEQTLSELLKKRNIVQSPQVTLLIEEYKSRQVAILGKVNKPGRYAIEKNSSVLDVIAEAGGITEQGSEKILLNRKGKSRVIDISALLVGTEGGDVDLAVRNGDVIYVPRMEVIYVFGEVQRPGEYPLRGRLSVMQALSIAGGLNDKGTQRGLVVRRRDAGNKNFSMNVKPTDVLEPNDVLVVKEGLF